MKTKRLKVNYIKIGGLKVVAAIIVPLFISACGGGTNNASSFSNSNPDLDSLGTGTGTGTGTSTGTSTDTGSLGGLFDNDLSGDTASTGSTTLGSLTPTESQCLNGSTSSSSNSNFSGSLACLSNSASSTGQISDQAFFQAGISSFGQMNTCRQLVMQAKPAAGATQAQVAYSFYIAKLAMVRCIRNLTSQQANFLPWNTQTQGSYQYTDNVLWGLLQQYGRR